MRSRPRSRPLLALVALVASVAFTPAALAGDPTPADQAFRAAEKALEIRDYELARKKVDETLAADAAHAHAKAVHALVAACFGEDKKALEWIEKAKKDYATRKSPEEMAEEERAAGGGRRGGSRGDGAKGDGAKGGDGKKGDKGKGDKGKAEPDEAMTPAEREWYYRDLIRGIEVVLKNPFEARYGSDAAKLQGKSKPLGGHYLLATDCGAGDLSKVKAGQLSKGHAEISGLLEKIYECYSVVFPYSKDKRLVSRVIVFDKREDYNAFATALDPEDTGEDSMGYYHPTYRLLVIANDPIGNPIGCLYQDSMDTVFHEGFHQFLDYFVADVPYWFNEGIAEYFGPSEVVPNTGGKQIRVGVLVKERAETETRYQTIRGAIAAGKHTPLRDLLRMDAETFMQRADIHYAESWSLIHFFMHGSTQGKSWLVKYFQTLRAGKGDQAAFDAAFGSQDFSKLEADWKKYLNGL